MKTQQSPVSAYNYPPERLRSMLPEMFPGNTPDVFGVNERLLAITETLPKLEGWDQQHEPPSAIDLGGHSGFFSMSLVDKKFLKASTVYDLCVDSLDAGKEMVKMLSIEDQVHFKEQAITLDWLRGIEQADVVLCLNLIHHAGTLFDIDDVNSRGWQAYANDWLRELRRIAKYCILGVGFKKQKLGNWHVGRKQMPIEFRSMITDQGWKTVYDANVQDIYDYGVEKANGMRTIGHNNTNNSKIKSALKNLKATESLQFLGRLLKNQQEQSKRDRYHLYILE